MTLPISSADEISDLADGHTTGCGRAQFLRLCCLTAGTLQGQTIWTDGTLLTHCGRVAVQFGRPIYCHPDEAHCSVTDLGFH